ncbi:MAG: DUF1080 domain-containing protein [Isosphaeraceae bacterium]
MAALFLGVGTLCLADDEGFTPLFDGQSLKGWTVMGGKAEAWSVVDGRIVSKGDGGGWLGTTKSYENFVLRLEFRLTSGSNSGVYLRAPADTSHISRTGMEIQILDETHPRHKGIKDWQRTGAIYHVAPPKPGHNRPIGEWNTMEITANGPRVSIRLNGALVVDDRIDQHPNLASEHPGLSRKSGLIGLQSHNDRVEFRNLQVKALPGPGA